MKKYISIALMACLIMIGLSAPVLAYQDPACGTLTGAAKEAAGCNTEKTLPNVVIDILNVMIGLIGVVAVIVIIIGGINFSTSSGEASKVKKAKDTILYGVIGLVVAILAFAIVSFIAGAIA